MSYTPTQWKDGDLVTSAKLNKMEQGIANGSGGSLIVHANEQTGTLDKTWKEIYDAMQEQYVCIVMNHEANNFIQSQIASIESVHSNGQIYALIAILGTFSDNQWIYDPLIFSTDSENGYPVHQQAPETNK